MNGSPVRTRQITTRAGLRARDDKSPTVEDVVAVARDGAGVRLSADGRDANARARRLKRQLIGEGKPLYGCTTEVGARSDMPAVPSREAELELLRGHACGTGDLLAPEQVRAALVVRLNQLAAGGAGVSLELLDGLTYTLNAGAVPVVHEIGSLGTADLTAMAEIGLALAGEGSWHLGSGDPPAPIHFHPGDAIGLLSSNACTIGQAALACHDVEVALRSAESVAALSFVALAADRAVLDPRTHQARPHPGQAASANRLRRLIGSPKGSSRLQDAFCCRSLPQVHGAAGEAAGELRRVLDVELNAASENPLLLSDTGEVWCTGNFDTTRLALVVDQTNAGLAQAGTLAATRASRLLDGTVTGLPDFLTGPDRSRVGMMVIEYPIHDALAQLRACGNRTTAASIVICAGVENHAGFAPVGIRQLRGAPHQYVTIVACELVVAVRAFRMASRSMPTAAGQAVLDRAASVLAADLTDRPLTGDIATAADLIRAGLGADI